MTDHFVGPSDGTRTFDGDVIKAYYRHLTGRASGSATYDSVDTNVSGESGLRMRDLSAYARILPAPRGRALRVDIALDHAMPCHIGGTLLQIGASFQAADLANAEALFKLAVGTPQHRRAALEALPRNGGSTLSAEIVVGSDTRAIALLVFAEDGEAVLKTLHVDTSYPTAALARVGGANPQSGRARYVAAGSVVRESFVMLAGDRATFQVSLVAASALFRGAISTVAGTSSEGGDVSIRVLRARDGTELAKWDGHADEDRWEPFNIRVGSLDGEARVEIRVEDSPKDESRCIVAIGAAVFEDLAGPQSTDAPDAAIVSIDTLRRDRLPVYGHGRDTSPHITKLAQDSVVFDHAFSPASWTLPAHVSLFTGRSPQGHGVVQSSDSIDPESAVVLARAFRDAGYETIAFTAGGYLAPDFGLVAGFEQYCFEDPVTFSLEDGQVREATGSARTSLREVLARPPNRPRFLFVHTYAAHDYLADRDDLIAMGLPAEDLHRVNVGVKAEQQGRAIDDAYGTPAAGPAIDRLDRLYDASIRAADRLLGEVADSLPWRERRDHVLVVTSDHGEELYEHRKVGHGRGLSEELIQIPLIVQHSLLRPRRLDAVVSLTDLAPTISSLCGVPFPTFEGRDLSALLLDDESLPPQPALLGLGQSSGLRGTRWKIISQKGATAIYDIQSDPTEDNDLSTEDPTQLKRLQRALVDRARSAKSMGQSAVSGGRISADALRRLRELGYLGGSE